MKKNKEMVNTFPDSVISGWKGKEIGLGRDMQGTWKLMVIILKLGGRYTDICCITILYAYVCFKKFLYLYILKH